MSLATDPGITYNLYSGQTTYTIPGKKNLYSGYSVYWSHYRTIRVHLRWSKQPDYVQPTYINSSHHNLCTYHSLGTYHDIQTGHNYCACHNQHSCGWHRCSLWPMWRHRVSLVLFTCRGRTNSSLYIRWTGGTACVSPYTCTVSSAYVRPKFVQFCSECW